VVGSVRRPDLVWWVTCGDVVDVGAVVHEGCHLVPGRASDKAHLITERLSVWLSKREAVTQHVPRSHSAH